MRVPPRGGGGVQGRALTRLRRLWRSCGPLRVAIGASTAARTARRCCRALTRCWGRVGRRPRTIVRIVLLLAVQRRSRAPSPPARGAWRPAAPHRARAVSQSRVRRAVRHERRRCCQGANAVAGRRAARRCLALRLCRVAAASAAACHGARSRGAFRCWRAGCFAFIDRPPGLMPALHAGGRRRRERGRPGRVAAAAAQPGCSARHSRRSRPGRAPGCRRARRATAAACAARSAAPRRASGAQRAGQRRAHHVSSCSQARGVRRRRAARDVRAFSAAPRRLRCGGRGARVGGGAALALAAGAPRRLCSSSRRVRAARRCGRALRGLAPGSRRRHAARRCAAVQRRRGRRSRRALCRRAGARERPRASARR